MRVEILRIDECPSWQQAVAAVRAAALQIAIDDLDLTVRVIRTGADAADAGFAGSPTILINGHDPFPSEAPIGELACRIYWTERGAAGAPTVDQLVAALQAAA